MNKQRVKELALANGFKLKQQPDGTEDLNPYVYEFAAALAAEAGRAGFVAGADWLWTNGLTIKPYNLENCKVEAANDYVDSIRQGEVK